MESQNEIETKIAELEFELRKLKQEKISKQTMVQSSKVRCEGENTTNGNFTKCELSNIEIEKYSRQMILSEIGVEGMIKL